MLHLVMGDALLNLSTGVVTHLASNLSIGLPKVSNVGRLPVLVSFVTVRLLYLRLFLNNAGLSKSYLLSPLNGIDSCRVS
jgi:hypothetical protein